VKWWQKKYLLQRDGPFCKGGCGRCEPEEVLTIDHVDGDPANNDPMNLRMMCRSCQMKARWKQVKEVLSAQKNIPVDMGSQLLQDAKNRKLIDIGGENTLKTDGALSSENSSNQGDSVTSMPEKGIQKIEFSGRVEDGGGGKESVDEVGRGERLLAVGDESPEMRVSREKEPLFRGWVVDSVVTRHEGLTIRDAVTEGAEVVGVSPNTTRRWLSKLTSPVGPLKIGEGSRGLQRLLLREEYWK